VKGEKTASAGPAIQLLISFVERPPAAVESSSEYVAADDDLPAIFFAEVEATDEGAKAPAGGSENLDSAEAVTD
jgi:hypothetical protein